MIIPFKPISATLFFLFLFSHALPYSHPFRNYSVNDGLPFIHVYTIFQDSRGYLWSGGYGGLSSFDGFRFDHYSPKDGLADHWVTSIAEDRNGILWVGTIRGLNRLEPQHGTGAGKMNFITYPPPIGEAGGGFFSKELRDNRINHVFIANDGDKWIATNNGVCRINEKSSLSLAPKSPKGDLSAVSPPFGGREAGGGALVYNASSGLAGDSVTLIFQEKKGNIWIGTRTGLTRLTGNAFKNFTAKNGLCGNHITALSEDENGMLCIGTTEGLCFFNGTGFVNAVPLKEDQVRNITCLLPNATGSGLWVGTTTGLFLYDGNKFTPYHIKGTANSNWIECLFSDRENNLWAGTYDGLFRYCGDAFTTYSADDGLLNTFIFPILRDPNGILWVGTNDGLYAQMDLAFLTFSIRNGIAGNQINALLVDRNNKFWIATNNGLTRCSPNDILEYKRIPPPVTIKDGLLHNESFSLYQDKDGIIWIGTREGVSKFDPASPSSGRKKFTSYSIRKEGGDLQIRSFAEDKNGNLLAGAYNGGLFIYSDTGFTEYGSQIGLPANTILSIISDQKGNLWFGTLDGVFCFADERMRVINESSGLSSDLVYLMVMDENEKHLWIGTNQGLNKLDVPEFLSGEKPVLEHYGSEDGFSGVECNTNALREKDGSIWFSTVNGLIRYNQNAYRENTEEAKILITGIRVHYTDTLLASGVRLPWSSNNVSFQFSGICFTNPHKVRYSYKLANYDKGWSPPSDRNFTTYSNLRPGNYIFNVKCCNNENIWNKTPASFQFTILAPFWQTIWFRIGLALFALLAIWAVFYFRVKTIRRQNELQRRMDQLKLQALRAQMNPHFIFNALNAIQHYMNVNDKRNANDYLSRFAQLIRIILNSSDKKAVTLSDDLKAVQLYIELEDMRFENKFDFSIVITGPAKPDFVTIPPMIIQPYVENAILHGLLNLEGTGIKRKGNLLIKIHSTEDFIRCTIEDNGVGRKRAGELNSISDKSENKPMGMSITEQRIETFRKLERRYPGSTGIIDLFDDAGNASGTRVEIDIPVVGE